MPTNSCSYPQDRRYINDLIQMIQAKTGLDRNTVELALRGKTDDGRVENDNHASGNTQEAQLNALKVNNKDEKISTAEVAKLLGRKIKGTWELGKEEYQKVAIFKNSTISRDEVSKYLDGIRRLLPAPSVPVGIFTDHPKDKIAKALYEIYYNGEQLFENKGDRKSVV